MTPPAATAAPRSHVRRPARTAAPRTPRRVSGPAQRPVRGSVALPGGALTAPPLGLRLARLAVALPDARVLDRLVRGRLWIVLLAAALVGIVFLQISLLKLNTGISRAVETTQTLEGQNTELKLELSRLAGGERVQDSAAARGFLTPATGQPTFLDARRPTPTQAAANITPPSPVEQLPLGMIPPAQGGTAGIAPPAGAVTPEATSPEAVTPVPEPTPAPEPAVAPAPAPEPAVAPAPVTPPAAAAATAAPPAATAAVVPPTAQG